MGLSHMFKKTCVIVERLWVKKNLLVPSLTFFVNMLVGRKLYPPCPMFIKVHSTMLSIVNMLKMKFFYVSQSVLDKVMQGVAHEVFKRIIQFVTIFYLFQDGKPMLEYEGMKACCKSFK